MHGRQGSAEILPKVKVAQGINQQCSSKLVYCHGTEQTVSKAIRAWQVITC